MCFLISFIDPLLPIPKPAWYFEGVQTENHISCVVSVERITNDIGFSRTLAIHSSRQQLDAKVTKVAAPYIQFLSTELPFENPIITSPENKEASVIPLQSNILKTEVLSNFNREFFWVKVCADTSEKSIFASIHQRVVDDHPDIWFEKLSSDSGSYSVRTVQQSEVEAYNAKLEEEKARQALEEEQEDIEPFIAPNMQPDDEMPSAKDDSESIEAFRAGNKEDVIAEKHIYIHIMNHLTYLQTRYVKFREQEQQ